MKLTIFSTNTDTNGEPPFPVRADSIYKGENKMPEQNSITKNVKLKSGRQFAKCKALSSRLFILYKNCCLFVGENRVLPHGEPPFPIRVDSL